MKKLNFLSGLIIGLAISCTISVAAASGIIANITSQLFFLNDTRVELEAYNINGSNYIKLRDAANLFNTEIEYDEKTNSVYIGSHQKDAVENYKKPEKLDGSAYAKMDYSQNANPEIFDDTYTKEAYNALYQSLADIEVITQGTDEYGYNPNYVYAHFVAEDSDFQTVGKTEAAVKSAAARISAYYDFTFGWEPFIKNLSDYPGYRICRPFVRDTLTPAKNATDTFIQNLSGLTDREKIRRIADYVSVSIVYKDEDVAGINEVFTSSSPVNGICGTYASSFLYLCQRAGIPCLTVVDDTHAWNWFYADGSWYVSDIGYYDITRTDEMLFRTSYQRRELNPELTKFVMELLVPGSTK